MSWPNRRLLDRLGIEHPIIQSPMAGTSTNELAIAVAEAGGLGSLACAGSSRDQVRADMAALRARTGKPINVNFYAHRAPAPDPARDAAWLDRLRPYFAELGLEPVAATNTPVPRIFDAAMCDVLEDLRPAVVSFHFGLPPQPLVERVKALGCLLMSSATTVAEALWLETQGCDAIIAQGYEAGGHRGMFLTADITTQTGTLALVPQVVDAVKAPVIAAGGIGDGRGIAAVMALGASAAQIGTAFLFTPEVSVEPAYHQRLMTDPGHTALTNVFTGRPARAFVNRLVQEVGPMSPLAPAFPDARFAVTALRAGAGRGAAQFAFWNAGQAAGLGRSLDAAALTHLLADDAQRTLRFVAGA